MTFDEANRWCAARRVWVEVTSSGAGGVVITLRFGEHEVWAPVADGRWTTWRDTFTFLVERLDEGERRGSAVRGRKSDAPPSDASDRA